MSAELLDRMEGEGYVQLVKDVGRLKNLMMIFALNVTETTRAAKVKRHVVLAVGQGKEYAAVVTAAGK